MAANRPAAAHCTFHCCSVGLSVRFLFDIRVVADSHGTSIICSNTNAMRAYQELEVTTMRGLRVYTERLRIDI